MVNVNNKIVQRIFYKLSISKGFTLIEMLVVVGIISILAAVLISAINPVAQLQKSNDAHRKADLESLQHALELYYQDKGSYPTSSADFKLLINGTTLAWGSAWQPYMSILPKDPFLTNSYVYYSPASGNGQTYYLYANIQRGVNDPQACNKGNACQTIGSAAGFPSANACGGICNYGVASSNVSP